ncbi:hypothetical protein [Escherichia coli]|uniref:hypothetical protein n=1 Tax=Escherichia coli TaxID=562 RepID=UPI000CFB0988|nr:hypothetical protein [Escherichia coli]
MKFSKFSELVNRILSNNHSHHRDMDVTIVVHSPGRIGSTPSVEVQSIQAGFDWDAGQVMIFPAQPLTTLTPEQITDITDSVRKGQSWHAYQEYKKHKEQLEKLSIELDAAKQRVAELEASRVTLAEENSWLKMLIEDHAGCTAVCPNCSHEEPSETDDIVWSYRSRETPATDAFLSEVRAQGVDMARNAMIDFVDGEVGPNKNVPGLIRGAEICVSIAEQLRKGVIQ